MQCHLHCNLAILKSCRIKHLLSFTLLHFVLDHLEEIQLRYIVVFPQIMQYIPRSDDLCLHC